MLSFPDRPGCSAEDLRQDVRELVPLISPQSTEATIGTTETPVAHGLGETPASVSVMPHADARWWRTKAPDRDFVYLAASVSVTCTVTVSR